MVKWGIVGCGDIVGKRIVSAIRAQKDSEVRSVMSPYADEVEAFGSRHGIKYCFTSLEEMLSDGEISTVYIATPVYLHYGAAKAALNAGKHVLVEKPMAMNVKECQDLIDEAAKKWHSGSAFRLP